MAPATDPNHSGGVVHTAETKTIKWRKCIVETVLLPSGGKEILLVQRKGALAAALQPFVKNLQEQFFSPCMIKHQNI